MKVDFFSQQPVFRKPGAQNGVKSKAASDARTGKTDQVEFSRGQSSAPDKSLAALKSTILTEVAASVGTDKLNSLQDKIRSGSYRPSTEEIVDAILGE